MLFCPFLRCRKQHSKQFIDPVILSAQIQPAKQRFHSRCQSIFCRRGRFRHRFRLGIASMAEYCLLCFGEHWLDSLGTGSLSAGTNQMDGFPVHIPTGYQSGTDQIAPGHNFIHTVSHMSQGKLAALLKRLLLHHRMKKISHNVMLPFLPVNMPGKPAKTP